MTHLSNVLQYRKEVSNLDIGTEKEEKGNSKTAQSFLFGWLGCGWEKVHCSQRLSVCLAEFVYVVDRVVEKVHTLCYFSAFSSCLALNL